MGKHVATIAWQRQLAGGDHGQDYSRVHEWLFDGGAVVRASSSPHVVPVPLSDPSAVDPEEALIAAASSCHMLFFLVLAEKRGFPVARYRDDAVGQMARNGQGRAAITRIRLRPRIEFSGATPAAEELAAIHHEAHERCFIANSLRSEIVVEPA